MTTVPPDDATSLRGPGPGPGSAVADGAGPPGTARRNVAGIVPRYLPGAAYPAAVWVVWRVVQLGVSVYLGGPNYKFTAVNAAFFYDGERYLQITKQGYLHVQNVMPNTAFFPGVSWVAWPLWRILQSEAWTAHVVATLTGLATFVTVWGVSRAWKGDEVARRAVWLLAFFPSSLFLWSFYSEGLFMALTAGAVWADRRDRRGIAALCLFGLATTRSVGVLIGLTIVLARVIRNRRADGVSAGYATAAIAGLLPVLWMMRYYTGDAFAFMKVQADWGRALSPPWTTIANGFATLWPEPSTIMVPALVARNFDLWCLLIVAVAVGWLAFARRERFPVDGWLLGIALVALPLCSTSLASFNRFTLANWVIYPAFASMVLRVPRPWRHVVWTAMLAVLAVTSYHMIGRFSVDRFIG